MFTELLTTTTWLVSDESIGDDDADDSTTTTTFRRRFLTTLDEGLDENLVEDFDEGGDTTVISATTDLVSLSDELPDLSNALGERNRTYTDTSPLGVNPYRQGLIWWQTVCN